METHPNKTLVVSSQDVQQIVQHFGLNRVMDTLTARLRIAIQHFDPQNTQIPARSGFHYEQPHTGLIEWMPLYNENDEQIVIKVVGYHPSNPQIHHVPTIISTISAYDTSTGHLRGIMDGVLLTALRTGAASAVASQVLAHFDSSVLGLIGCGAQAVTQLHALSRVFNFTQVLIYDIDPNAVFSFQERCAMLNLDVEILSTTIERIVENSDIICTATSIDVGAGPLFSNLKTKPTLHINAVGSDFPGKVELPIDLLKDSFVCPDFKSQAVAEGECQQLSEADINEDWVQVLQQPEKYEFIKNQRSVFDSTGWALEDQIVMDLFLEYASELGLGQEIEIETVPEDAKNPYHFLGKPVSLVL